MDIEIHMSPAAWDALFIFAWGAWCGWCAGMLAGAFRRENAR